ncbi:uncharacterized protein V6R79_020029 [Siganus canaliculatus]
MTRQQPGVGQLDEHITALQETLSLSNYKSVFKVFPGRRTPPSSLRGAFTGGFEVSAEEHFHCERRTLSTHAAEAASRKEEEEASRRKTLPGGGRSFQEEEEASRRKKLPGGRSFMSERKTLPGGRRSFQEEEEALRQRGRRFQEEEEASRRKKKLPGGRRSFQEEDASRRKKFPGGRSFTSVRKTLPGGRSFTSERKTVQEVSETVRNHQRRQFQNTAITAEPGLQVRPKHRPKHSSV